MLENIILDIGTERFGKSLFVETFDVLALRHLVVYRHRPDAQVELLFAESDHDDPAMRRAIHAYSTALHTRDPLRPYTRPLASRQLDVRHIEARGIRDVAFRNDLYRHQQMRSKTAIVVRRPEDAITIGIFRGEEKGALTDAQWGFIHRSAGVIAAAVERHATLTARPADIEWREKLAAIETAKKLSAREIDVCARILDGHFTESIAINMGVSAHSVVTYRRRAFAKLGVGTRSELFNLVARGRIN